ncbi:hypothetical protein JCM33374_g3246 [Metschnikowia sp. JCM 33374]|nr:hypothetical protein JCM33374_g3246 [Metschnikowia sp. JCM 33374]
MVSLPKLLIAALCTPKISAISVNIPRAGMENITKITLPKITHPKATPSFRGELPYIINHSPYIYDGSVHLASRCHQNITAQIEIFMKCLKSFVHNTVFEDSEFRLSAHMLQNQLAHINWHIDHRKPVSLDLLTKLAFAEKVFHTMLQSAILMEFYNPDTWLAHRIIFKACQLNVVLLFLHNLLGQPDPSIPGYSESVFRSNNLLTSWKSIFLGLGDMSASLMFVFDLVIEQTENTLFVLERFTEEYQNKPWVAESW